MTESRLKTNWDRTAQVLAMIANVNRDSKKRVRPYEMYDFHPYRKKQKRFASKEDLEMLRGMFENRKKRNG